MKFNHCKQFITFVLYISSAEFVSWNLDWRISFTLVQIRSRMREDASTVSEIKSFVIIGLHEVCKRC